MEDGQRSLLMLLRFRRLMALLLLLMLGLVVLGFVGLKRHAAPAVVHGVFIGAALCALAMLLAPLVLAWLARKRSLVDRDHHKAP
ncbi:MAG: hypothetical protein KGM17_09765 [Sphingomonadales bacterium]|nr:hypothetical protein [Sphingomonadales bacterium]